MFGEIKIINGVITLILAAVFVSTPIIREANQKKIKNFKSKNIDFSVLESIKIEKDRRIDELTFEIAKEKDSLQKECKKTKNKLFLSEQENKKLKDTINKKHKSIIIVDTNNLDTILL